MEFSNENVVNSLQADEIEALSSIFGDDIEFLKNNAFTIRIYDINDNAREREVYLQVAFPENYPHSCAPIYDISAPWMNGELKQVLCSEIEKIYSQNIGESVIYLYVETIKKFITEPRMNPEKQNLQENKEDRTGDSVDCRESELKGTDVEIPVIEHGEIITDRKSVFQAHFAKITSEKQVELILEKLKQNTKIASATHNVYAYRVSSKNGRLIQDYNDDGESKAGSKLLYLLEVSNLSDILLIVTRWYGGIHLGSDRFKHYSNAAINLFSHAGFLKTKLKKQR